MKRITLNDLTAGQVEAIEKDLGEPFQAWFDKVSVVTLYVKVLAAHNGDGEDRYRSMRLRELQELVGMEDATDPPPSGPSEPGE